MALIESIEAVTKVPISQDIRDRLEDEGLTLDSFKLLDEDNLVELGFRMGARKLLMHWIKADGTVTHHTQPHSASATPTSSISHSEETVSNAALSYNVEELLMRIDRTGAPVRGPDLVEKLKGGTKYERQERIWMLKNLGRYLMENCRENSVYVRKNHPTKDEKVQMVSAIVTTFPCLYDHSTEHGYETLYDPVSKTGHLEFYIRQRRSRSLDIKTMWTHKKKSRVVTQSVDLSTDDTNELERIMHERRPTAATKDDMLDMMARTREVRRAWITTEAPDCTTICRRYPRLLDMNAAVDEEFTAIMPDVERLRVGWSRVRDNIIAVAQHKAGKDVELKEELKDIEDMQEDAKTQLSFRSLPYLLVPPPRKGVKRPRMSRKVAVSLMFADTEESATVEDAVAKLRKAGVTQPALFQVDGCYFVKLDNMSVCVDEPSCFADVVDFLFRCYWVFGVEYPQSLRLVYGFLERVSGIPQSMGNSTILRDFITKVM